MKACSYKFSSRYGKTHHNGPQDVAGRVLPGIAGVALVPDVRLWPKVDISFGRTNAFEEVLVAHDQAIAVDNKICFEPQRQAQVDIAQTPRTLAVIPLA